VTAIDTNVRFLRPLAPGVEVLEGEVGRTATLASSFDVVHARYVLIHNADAASVLDAMLRALAPGGVLVLEEPDFSAARAFTGPPESRRAFDAVQRALGATFAGRNMNSAFGALLPALLEERGAKVVSMEYDCPVVAGGSALAEMMRLSTLALAEKYVATGFATPEDLAGYAEFAASPACRATYYANVRVIAR
jgi:SAM-dependent methyltransferase